MTQERTPGDNHDRDEHGLTPRQRMFADVWLELLQNGETLGMKKKAAIQAGYAPSDAASNAWKNMRHPAVIAYIGKQFSAASAKVSIDLSYVLFNAVVLLETCKAQGDTKGMAKALELVGKHVDVRAFLPGTAPAPGGGAGVNLPFDLSHLSTDEKRSFLDMLTRSTGNPVESS